MAKAMTWHEAIRKVLKDSGEPLHYTEITNEILTQKLFVTLGATPARTVSKELTTSVKDLGDSSPFVRVSKGVYAIRVADGNKSKSLKKTESAEQEEQYGIITSFGMFWRKNAVEWTSKPRLLGMQNIGSRPVDFNKQIGIYLLYDGREIIYVGRSTERPLGRRLYEHTMDRFAARWDRFSWFGLSPVSDEGELSSPPAKYSPTELFPALEAVLIEALEPRQNRKRGDDLAAVEYMQTIDPEIEIKKAQAIISGALAQKIGTS
jgi:HB1/ASXL restriction endonuclease-like protein with HTH domain